MTALHDWNTTLCERAVLPWSPFVELSHSNQRGESISTLFINSNQEIIDVRNCQTVDSSSRQSQILPHNNKDFRQIIRIFVINKELQFLRASTPQLSLNIGEALTLSFLLRPLLLPPPPFPPWRYSLRDFSSDTVFRKFSRQQSSSTRVCLESPSRYQALRRLWLMLVFLCVLLVSLREKEFCSISGWAGWWKLGLHLFELIGVARRDRERTSFHQISSKDGCLGSNNGEGCSETGQAL